METFPRDPYYRETSKCLSNTIMTISQGFDKGHNWKKGKGAFNVPWRLSRTKSSSLWVLYKLYSTWVNTNWCPCLREAESSSPGWHPNKSNVTNNTILQKQRGSKIILIILNRIQSPRFSVILGLTVRALIQIISQLTGQPKSSALKLDVLEFSEITKSKKKKFFWPDERDKSDFYLYSNICYTWCEEFL